MTNYSHGHEAEKVAATWLKKQGYKIIEINWKRPQAEIDIIVRKKRNPMTFVEVKYREGDSQGGGLSYITEPKLRQMQFAAECWVHEHRYEGEYCLAAIEVSGTMYAVTEFIADLSGC